MADRDRPPLAPLLRELDEQLEQESLPVGARNRIELSIRDHSAARRRSGGLKRWLPAATFAAGAALVFAVVRMRSPQPPMPTAGPPVQARTELAVAGTENVGEFALAGKDCSGVPQGNAALLQGNCKLVASHLTAQVWGEARVEPGSQGLRVHEGQLLFDVESVAAGERPVTVAVSHGTIEVVGTQFIVDQRADGGHVDLFEGSIRFRGTDGEVVELGPGQRHRWGAPERLVAAADPAPLEEPELEELIEIDDDELEQADTAPRRVRRRPGPTRSERAAALIERVGELRADHRYREAVKQLRAALDQRWDRRTAEVLSYELGELLHRYLGERQAACDHLRAHSERFAGGRYDTAIGRTLKKLQCD